MQLTPSKWVVLGSCGMNMSGVRTCKLQEYRYTFIILWNIYNPWKVYECREHLCRKAPRGNIQCNFGSNCGHPVSVCLWLCVSVCYHSQDQSENCPTSFALNLPQGVKLLGSRISETPKNSAGNPKFGPGFPTGNLRKWYGHRHVVYRWKAPILIFTFDPS